jgi:hypothetical protein
MRATKLLFFCALVFAAGELAAQQKSYDWIAQSPNSFRIGPGYHSGVAVYNPHGWEPVHVRLDIAARQPVSVGVVRLEDWNNAVHNPEMLSRLDYACLAEGVTHISYSCNFYASYTSRVVVVRDARGTERPIVTGAAAPFLRNGVNELFANDVEVTPYRWECVSNCELPDPPQFAWVDVRKEKFEITPALKSYGPFAAQGEEQKLRVRVKSPYPMTAAIVAAGQADDLFAHPDQAREILSRSACKEYGVQSSTFDCTIAKADGAMQVLLIPEGRIRKTKKAEITISESECVANCENQPLALSH